MLKQTSLINKTLLFVKMPLAKMKLCCCLLCCAHVSGERFGTLRVATTEESGLLRGLQSKLAGSVSSYVAFSLAVHTDIIVEL